MKITKRQLKRIIKEVSMSYDMEADTTTSMSAGSSPVTYTRDDYYDMISDFSKELTGRRGNYYRPDDLDTMDIKQVADYYESMFDSPEAQAQNADYELEMQKQQDSEIGLEKDQPSIEKQPVQQGMGRKTENAMKITKKQLQRIIKEEKQKLLVEMNPIANAERASGSFANISTVDSVTDGILNLLQEIEMGGAEEEGLMDDEAEEFARNGAILVVAQAFQSAGLMDVYTGLTKMLR